MRTRRAYNFDYIPTGSRTTKYDAFNDMLHIMHVGVSGVVITGPALTFLAKQEDKASESLSERAVPLMASEPRWSLAAGAGEPAEVIAESVRFTSCHFNTIVNST